MNRYLESRGYLGVGYGKLRFTDLLGKEPLIVPLADNNLNRFVIFRGAIKDIVLLADPHLGNRTMRRDAFERAWLDYGQDMGKIGFVIKRSDGTAAPNQLRPMDSDFILDLNGNGELLLANAHGEKIGFVEGKYSDEISDAELFDDPGDDRWQPVSLELQYPEDGQLPAAVDIQLPEVAPVVSPKVGYTKAARRYYFYQDTKLTADVSGTAAGTYDLVKTKEDAIVQLLNVPTADNVKDTIVLSDVGELSITFDSHPHRRPAPLGFLGQLAGIGKYDLSISNHLDQFQAHNLPVMPAVTFHYRVNWEALHDGENGVTIKIDESNDGNIDFTGSVGANLDDAIAPTTTRDIAGTQLRTGSYLPGTALTLVATDNDGGIGVNKTEYSLDNGSSGPVTPRRSSSMK
jgi:hypothetical protein